MSPWINSWCVLCYSLLAITGHACSYCCCHSAKLCAHAARDFRSQHYKHTQACWREN